MRIDPVPPTPRCPHCKVEMECVDDEQREYLCELCSHEMCIEYKNETPEFFKSKAAFNKWKRKRRKAARIAIRAYRAECRRARHNKRRK